MKTAIFNKEIGTKFMCYMRHYKIHFIFFQLKKEVSKKYFYTS